MKKLLLILLSCFYVEICAQSIVTVDASQEHQTISGFGAFGGIKAYWETPPFYTDKFIEYYLEDMGSTIVRTNIFWDLEPVNDNSSPYDLDLAKFNYKAGSNLAKQLPYYKALKEAGLKKLIATSWTPPVWMKLFDQPDRIPKECYNCNNCPVGDPNRSVCGGRLNPAYYHEFAEYLVAYVKILKQEIDVDLYAINIQNEPFFANPFEAAVVLPDEFADILKIVGEHFRQEGLTTKIYGPEHMAEWSWGVQQNYVTQILEDNDVAPYLDIYAVHGYVDGVAPDFGSAEGWTALHNNISLAHDKPLWMTETSGYAQTFKGAMDLAKSIYLALRFGNISAWVYWGISGEPGSEYSLMANGEPTILYHASKQFYKFIRPGAIRVNTQSSDEEVLPVAFKNPTDGSMSIVLINTAASEKQIALEINERPEEFTVYRTSVSENCTEAGTVVNNIVLPPNSISTLIGYGTSGPSIDDIPNYYLRAGEGGALEIPLTGITDGQGGMLTFDIGSSNTAIAALPTLQYTYPAAEGKLLLTANTSVPGKSVITVKLTNENELDPGAFSFNSTQIQFSVEVIDVITAVKKKENDEIKIYPNPVERNLFIIDLGYGGRADAIEVLNNTGELVQRMKVMEDHRIELKTLGWRSGIYYIRIKMEKGNYNHKIVIP